MNISYIHVLQVLGSFQLKCFLPLHHLLLAFVSRFFLPPVIVVPEIIDYLIYIRTKNIADFKNAKNPDKLRASTKIGTSVSFHIQLYVLKNEKCLTFKS